MGITRSNSLVFSALQVLLSHLWEKKKRGGGEGKEGTKEYKRKGMKEEGIKKDQRQDKKEF